jgi:acyl-CoA synthetase (AMP-forming)/AMP-acid ligase II
VVAVVIAESDAEVDEARLQQQLAAKLSKYKLPRRVIRLPQAELPVMSSGKVEMRRLQQIVAGRIR